jgi:polysaccharide deacetylase 2 family uncharacterized protein YibQ
MARTRTIIRMNPACWPVPAGLAAGVALLLALSLSQPSQRSHPPGPRPADRAVAAPRSAPVIALPSVQEGRASEARRPLGLLLPPRTAASDLTRRIENGEDVSARAAPVAPSGAPAPRRPRIAVVIDDMGYDRVQSARAVRLPVPVTLSYLPDAPEVGRQVRRARVAGHEIMLHLPMEANDPTQPPERGVLSVSDDEAVLRGNLNRMLGRFAGFTGVNNHMGSRFTSDRRRMDTVLAELKSRGLFFLDSRTSGRSVGSASAEDVGISYAVRDVFLDHDPDPGLIRERIAETEEIAARFGQAIAIGHPRPTTMDLVGPWLAELESRGFEIVPVATLLTHPQPKRLARLATAE